MSKLIDTCVFIFLVYIFELMRRIYGRENIVRLNNIINRKLDKEGENRILI